MNVCVVGGGPAGMMAAIAAAKDGARVTLIEKNEKLGKKLFLTGKGRCNITNSCLTEELFGNIVRNPKFMYSSIYGFDNHAVIEFFEENGLRVKEERGKRIFPQSDHSSDVIKTLSNVMKDLDVRILLNTAVTDIETCEKAMEDSGEADNETVNIKTSNIESSDTESSDAETSNNKVVSKKKKPAREAVIKGVVLDNGTRIAADRVILATGGKSYPSTGSDGSFFKLLSEKNISITSLSPSLVPFTTLDENITNLQGLSLKNVNLDLFVNGKRRYSGFGEMLFTHFGISGPLVLSASTFLNDGDYNKKLLVLIDLKPSLDVDKLDKRVLRDFEENPNKTLGNTLGKLLPSRMIESVLKKSSLNGSKRVNLVTHEERKRLISALKAFEIAINGNRGFNEAIITRGGVSIKEINPSTMESKKIEGLFFAGEMIDVDAYTGGFNLQIAWSSGYAAGKSCAN